MKFKKELGGIVGGVCGGKRKHTTVKHTTLHTAARASGKVPTAARLPSSLLHIPTQGQGSHAFNAHLLNAYCVQVPEHIKTVAA